MNSKREYSIAILLEFLKQIASAMSYLEKKSIIHKNLSCRNYLVFNKSLVSFNYHRISISFIQVKLSDWSLSSSHIAWMSPEVIHFQRYTTASDAFSFGVSMWECFSYGESPWKDQVR
jgi:serine/threonine protein kinase